MEIELTTSPSTEDAKAISRGIAEFNTAMVPNLESEAAEVKFFVFSRDDDGTVTGGIRALCYWNMLHIELLWLSEDVRGSGLGGKLLKKAESFAISKGFKRALLFTQCWQAKPFYEKNGYTTQAELPEYPEGYTAYLMTKVLTG